MAEFNLGPYRINPTGEYDSTRDYRYLDGVSYNGNYYVCSYKGSNDEGELNTIKNITPGDGSAYWDIMALRGERGPEVNPYKNFITIIDGVWNYSLSDKIYIPKDNSRNDIKILNVENGSCGMIVTAKELLLPINSEYSKDFYYINATTNEYYIYTFVYGKTGLSGEEKFMWNRTVYINEYS